MPKVNEVEVKVSDRYQYYWCDDCLAKVPDFVIDTKRVVDDDEITTCDGCGKELDDNATA